MRSAQSKLAQILAEVYPKDIDTIAMGIQCKLGGKYQLTVRRAGEIVQQTDWFDNLILDQGLNYLGLYSNGTLSSASPFEYAHVGTGTSAASASQTQLDSYVAGVAYLSSSTSSSNSGAPLYARTVVQNYAFAQGAVVGNISEVGIGRTLVTGNLSSRARVVDGGGNPTTISITAIDQLTVSYALTITRNLAQSSGSVVLDGVTYPYTMDWHDVTNNTPPGGGIVMPRPASTYPFLTPARTTSVTIAWYYQAGTALSPTIVTDTSIPGTPFNLTFSSGAQVTNQSSYTYVDGSFTGVYSFMADTSQANLSGGIQMIRIPINLTPSSVPFFQCVAHFTTPIPKTNVHQLRMYFTISWSNG